MDRIQKEGLANLIGGAAVFLAGSALTAYNAKSIYDCFCRLDAYSLGVSDIFSCIIPASIATWGAFSPGLIGALSLKGYHFGEKE